MVPARRSAPSPVVARIMMPPVTRTSPGSSEHTRNVYHGTVISGRGRPKISTAMPNSNVHRRS
jgi:hypothetical protein